MTAYSIKFNVTKNPICYLGLVLLIVIALFSPLQQISAQDIASREEAKSIIESSIQEASKAIEDNKKLREERRKYIKSVDYHGPGAGYALPGSQPQSQTVAQGQETQLKEIDTKIANNDATIKTNKENAEKASKYLKKNFSNDIEKDENETYEELISAGFNETGNGEMEPCWSLTGGIAWSACVMTAGSWIASIIIYFFGGFLYVAGMLFDASIMISIEWLSVIFKADYISAAWRLVRDLANVFFIFILLYIALGTIFDLKGISDPQKMVVNVVIIALLVNFSGFFVRVVVDATNVIAYEFYSSAKGNSDNVGSSIVKKLIPEGYLVDKNAKLEGKPYFKGTSVLSLFVTIIFAIITIFVTSFVLVAASVLFIIRTLVLIFIYIISPFAFMSQIIPNKSFDYFEQWKNALVKQSLYAPGFLVPLYLVILLLNGDLLGGRLAQMNGGAVDTLFAGVLIVVLNGMLGLGLIISCIFIAQKFGAVGLGLATAMGAKFTQSSGQIMGRYGGRVAGNISKRIKPSEEWWEGGGVRRLARRSWDTGVLRSMRDSKAGQVVGQGVKNPLFSAGAGIGFMANQMGVKGMDNITGDKVFSKEVEERAGKYLEEMRKLETDNDRVRYLESLAGQGKREEFDAVYAKLSPEERRKLEQTSRRRGDAGNPRSQFLAQKLETSRKGLKLKAGQDTAIEMVKDLKLETNDDNQRVALIEHLSQDDLNAVYKGLSREEKVALERSATGNQALTARLGIARDKLKAGDKRAVERGMTSENAYIELKSKLESGQQIFEQDVTNLSKDRLLELSEANLTHVDVARHLTIGQLKAIRDSEIPNTTKKSIRLTIENLINTTNPNQMPDHLTKLAQYFNSAGAGFGD